ncbi:hypothetical protein PAMC26510_34995 [Caballeronia sordidicola]|nr:hypothetical protein PAMC26510_34995 [Caballeronia sordidicola]
MYFLKRTGYWDESLFENQMRISATRLWETGYQQTRINKLEIPGNTSQKTYER